MAKTFTYDETMTIYDDNSVREKLKFMDKWDAMIDDARNFENDKTVTNTAMEEFLQVGKSYKITVTLEELP